jgi:hypothetical protein
MYSLSISTLRRQAFEMLFNLNAQSDIVSITYRHGTQRLLRAYAKTPDVLRTEARRHPLSFLSPSALRTVRHSASTATIWITLVLVRLQVSEPILSPIPLPWKPSSYRRNTPRSLGMRCLTSSTGSSMYTRQFIAKGVSDLWRSSLSTDSPGRVDKSTVLQSLQSSGTSYDIARETLKHVSVDASGKVELEDWVEVRIPSRLGYPMTTLSTEHSSTSSSRARQPNSTCSRRQER